METKSNKLPLIVLATYWNESRFVQPSLAQIEELNPVEVIICDGAFNPKILDHSTDGTREILENFIETHKNARVVSPIRPGILKSAWLLLLGHKHLPWWTIFRFARWKFLIVSMIRTPYQRNEGLNFQHMISLSKEWKPGAWFMTCDSDQFFSDEMMEKIKKIISDGQFDLDLITGNEMTFFRDFKHYVNSYEKRIFNNMPHRIYSDTNIQPQRSVIRETRSGSLMNPRDILAKHLYVRFGKQLHAGTYFHYKLNSRERHDLGYKIGDRKKPNPQDYPELDFIGEHPRVIIEHFKL
ncbi:hypothetical protein A2738_03915 [Candidatus Nomurabacteria bacterium RIFCSPHIGHO2_01_FULL_42_15]|uniref:Glycosyltransferase 2-like domain-containing protein n=1 Tax=Candidatus Nomurabacteria bacterium RIFCSPHIGHO2_01_FULL_42_15 TaxID=1801742 RepID=A0A1F6VEF2_9BACT|nr:MAG: hypothetical protein A2738_03915 [Candidatus Nomurabacteria bacterium RIFCSPHIGHO2_01_FULL_42_15]OGI93349.1 MAG: hypothetical protein A3A99_03770 [Candidatus Nomurabacteria bacterium RIFCSPLOWO2_01_FULL_41_18]